MQRHRSFYAPRREGTPRHGIATPQAGETAADGPPALPGPRPPVGGGQRFTPNPQLRFLDQCREVMRFFLRPAPMLVHAPHSTRRMDPAGNHPALPVWRAVRMAVRRETSRNRPTRVSTLFQFLDSPPIQFAIRLRRLSSNGTLSVRRTVRDNQTSP